MERQGARLSPKSIVSPSNKLLQGIEATDEHAQIS
jgi:hypothetical protein